MTVKFRKIDEISMEGKGRRKSKELVECAQASDLQITCNSIYLLLSYYLVATRDHCILFLVPCCFWSETHTKLDNILWLIADRKMEMVDLLIKWALFMIMFFIWNQEEPSVPLLRFPKCHDIIYRTPLPSSPFITFVG